MISREEVKKIANLARIKISESEEERLQKDISAVLDYANLLSEVDVTAVSPQIHATNVRNVLREDELSEQELDEQEKTASDIVKSAPDYGDGFIRVKSIM